MEQLDQRRLVNGLTLFLFLSLISVGSVTVTHASKNIDMQNALKLVDIMEDKWKEVEDYTVTTYKIERHDELQPREKIFTKFRKPFSVYMRWEKDDPPEHKNPNLGQEMIYEKGWNNNKIYAHLGKRSFLPSSITSMAGYYYDWTALDPQSRPATWWQRHTIDEVPFGDVISRIAKAVRSGIKNPDHGVYFVDFGYEYQVGRPSGCIEGHLPDEKSDAYYDNRVKVCVDMVSKMPNRIIVRNENDKILEDYRMENIQLNVGLTTQDFRPDNPNYNFK